MVLGTSIAIGFGAPILGQFIKGGTTVSQEDIRNILLSALVGIGVTATVLTLFPPQPSGTATSTSFHDGGLITID